MFLRSLGQSEMLMSIGLKKKSWNPLDRICNRQKRFRYELHFLLAPDLVL
jgi:hypothetical protein